jgi:hypothetical protein
MVLSGPTRRGGCDLLFWRGFIEQIARQRASFGELAKLSLALGYEAVILPKLTFLGGRLYRTGGARPSAYWAGDAADGAMAEGDAAGVGSSVIGTGMYSGGKISRLQLSSKSVRSRASSGWKL